ncbi:WD40/YVTN repeat-like-containing domain superfamily protein [Abortiporus biennis]
MDLDTNIVWYRDSKDIQPFNLSRLVSSRNPDAHAFFTAAPFPWHYSSLEDLWDGALLQHSPEENTAKWTQLVDRWKGVLLVGSVGRLLALSVRGKAGPNLSLKILNPEGSLHTEWNVLCTAWALSSINPFNPLAIVAVSNVIFIFDLNSQKVIGSIRGHGLPITSISVHPRHPEIFCSSSKDLTTRFYNVSEYTRQRPNNPHWPPSKEPSLAGAAFGLQMSTSEGQGVGRCVAVLAGGRSGGHEAAVLCAALHPYSPLIATCGRDRAVKIWALPAFQDEALVREDKPLFSTRFIHKGAVLSISWLSQDILISHSAPAIMRKDPDGDDIYYEEGTIVIWRWLGFERFFPPDKPPQPNLRGCASDYTNSESFKIISCYSLPMTTRKLHVYRPNNGDPLLLIPMGKKIRIFNITNFKPRERPPFPLTIPPQKYTKGKHSKRDEDSDEEDSDPESDEERDGDLDSEERNDEVSFRPSHLPKILFESVDSWEIGADNEATDVADIAACGIGFGGEMIWSVGEKSTLAIWKLNKGTSTGADCTYSWD